MLNIKDIGIFHQQCFINGGWLDADSGASIVIRNPATGETLGSRRHCVGLVGQQQAARPLDAADAAITGIDDAPQPRAGRGTGRYMGGMGLGQRGVRQSVKMRLSVEGAVLCLLWPAA